MAKTKKPTLAAFMRSMLEQDPEKANEDWWTVEGEPEVPYLFTKGYRVSAAERSELFAQVAAGAAKPTADPEAGDDSGAEGDTAAAGAGDDPGEGAGEAKPAADPEAVLLKRRPWLKPDYLGPMTADQAAERGRRLRMKGLKPSGQPYKTK